MTALLIFAGMVLIARWVLGAVGRAYEAIDSFEQRERFAAAFERSEADATDRDEAAEL